MRVLVIEDDVHWRTIFGEILDAESTDTVFSPWGEALTKVAAGHNFDLIVLDLFEGDEPHPRGLRFLSDLGKLGKSIPIIAVTADKKTTTTMVRSLFHHGIADYFVKESFSDSEFRASIRKIHKREERTLDLAKNICARFHLVASELTHRRQGRPTILIDDEYDAQDLLRSLLNAYFDDVRPEEWVPSYAGGSARMDFLLGNERIVVELKMTRATLKQSEVVDQLIIDSVRYREHPQCETLICLVYDPKNMIRNVTGFETDIAKLSTRDLKIVPIVAPRSA
jgi:DNA-binding response OmpR family regulator